MATILMNPGGTGPNLNPVNIEPWCSVANKNKGNALNCGKELAVYMYSCVSMLILNKRG